MRRIARFRWRTSPLAPSLRSSTVRSATGSDAARVRMFDYTVEVVSRGREPIRVSAAFHAAIAATCAAP